MNRSIAILILTGVLACSPVLGQELLNNPSFSLPALTGCVEQQNVGVTGWAALTRRNGDFISPPCPRNGDGVYASMQGWDTTGGEFRQVVNGLSSANTYTFKGLMWLGKMTSQGTLTVTIELRSGNSANPANNPLIKDQVFTIRHAGPVGAWMPFCIQGSPVSPATSVMVRVRAIHDHYYGWAAHFDDFSLQVATNINQAMLTSISPTYGVQGSTTSVTLSGSGFKLGTNAVSSVKLIRPGHTEISATNIQASDTSITCDLNLAAAAMGPWTVKVSVANAVCPDLYLPGGFFVAAPDFVNGSFELPTAPGINCAAITPIAGGPTGWAFYPVGTWDDMANPALTLFRDSSLFPPTCPPPEGAHYASTTASATANWSAKPEAHIYQTIVANPAHTYLLSGFFAGRGDHDATIELLNGDETASEGQNGVIHVQEGDSSTYDWRFGFVQLQPTGNLLTARWRVSTRKAGPHVAHADDVRLEVCTGTPANATGITPGRLLNNGVSSVTIAGLGFTASPKPRFLLSKPNEAMPPILAGDVNIVNATTAQADFNLSGVPSGVYNLTVIQNGCVTTLEEAVNVVAATFVNGDFELPDMGSPINCGPPAQVIKGVPKGWSAVLPAVAGITPGFDRDLDVLQPGTCPAPAPAGGHYGSLSWDRGGEDAIAYQTIDAAVGSRYTFGGLFAGGGGNDVYIELRDGGLAGPVIGSTQVHSRDSTTAYDWTHYEVTATAASDTITVVWRMGPPGGFDQLHASHADGLRVTVYNPCNTPWADVEPDGDVDMNDFALMQRCLTGDVTTIPEDPEYCQCFDRVRDDKIDGQDVAAFIHCATGPNVPASGCP